MTNTKPSPAEQVAWLKSRSTHLIEPKELETRIKKGTLNVKFGVDPTTADLHLGHMVPVWILKKLQEWGHRITIVIGDFTALIGDPTGQQVERPVLSQKEITANAKTYRQQLGKVLEVSDTAFVFNSYWLNSDPGAPLSMGVLPPFFPKKITRYSTPNVLRFARHMTMAKALQREDFRKRERITLAEVMYSTLVGIDSVVLQPDLEIGGQDQLLNLAASRELMRAENLPPESILTTPILRGTSNDGRKMSKSFGNSINVLDNPNDMFGKVMSVPDAYLPDYFTLATELPESQWKGMVTSKPRDAKLLLAKTIVTTYHSLDAAAEASRAWTETFSKHRIPADVPTGRVFASQPSWIFVVSKHIDSKSNTEARRLIETGSIDLFASDATPLGQLKQSTPFPTKGEERILKIGKRKYVRVVFQ